MEIKPTKYPHLDNSFKFEQLGQEYTDTLAQDTELALVHIMSYLDYQAKQGRVTLNRIVDSFEEQQKEGTGVIVIFGDGWKEAYKDPEYQDYPSRLEAFSTLDKYANLTNGVRHEAEQSKLFTSELDQFADEVFGMVLNFCALYTFSPIPQDNRQVELY